MAATSISKRNMPGSRRTPASTRSSTRLAMLPTSPKGSERSRQSWPNNRLPRVASDLAFRLPPNRSVIRLASSADAAAIADIYRPCVESAVISFEYSAPTPEQMAQRIQAITKQFPWLVLEDNGVVAGYAYASAHSERSAYSWSVNCA